MSMSVGDNSGGPMSEINVTPLVDVMLVLLIIFMITAPLMSHSITIDLPIANPKTKDAEAQFVVNAQKSPQPELQIRADKNTEFKVVKKVIGDAKDSGMVHVGFMTTDAPKG